jgi:hypothetical protein
MNKNIPMGCHAWWSYDFDFGNPLLRILATGFV